MTDSKKYKQKPYREWTPEARARHRARARAWSKANRKKKTQAQRKWREKKYKEDPQYKATQVKSTQQWREENPEAYSRLVRNNNLKRNFGITIEQFEQMEIEQDYVCAICDQRETTTRNGKTISLHVDHCHKTGKIRGLLCNRCNNCITQAEKLGEGWFDAAAEYLKNG